MTNIELTEMEIDYIKKALIQDFYMQEAMLRLAFDAKKAMEFLRIRNSLKKKFNIDDY